MMQLNTSLAAVFDLGEVEHRRWRARVDRSWRGWTGPHGGVLAALALAAAERSVGGDVPVRAFDLRFLGRPQDGEVVLRTEPHGVGRSTHVVDVRVEQDDVVIASASATLGRDGATEVAASADRPAPEVPAPHDCAEFRMPAGIVPASAHFEIRPAAGPLPLTGADRSWMAAWIALVPAAPLDAPALAVLADGLPPAIFPTLTAPVAIPTVALSMHFPAVPDPVPAERGLVRTVNVDTGRGWSMDETDIWDERGRLLATARQSRRVLG